MKEIGKKPKEAIGILIVEDSPTQAEQLRFFLEQNRYDTALAKNGKEAIDLIDQYKPDFIITDIHMPEMNGYDLCRRIKSNQATRDIPVILLTSLSGRDEVQKGIECGADGFIGKPYSKNYLLSYLEQARIEAQQSINYPEVSFETIINGQKRNIKTNFQRMLSLLASTYEAARSKSLELIQSNNELLLSEEKFRNIFENSPVGKSLTSINGKLSVNQAFCNIVGYSAEELSGLNWKEITHPDDINESQRVVNSLIAGEKDHARYQKRYIHKSGEFVWVDISTFLQRDNNGNPLYFVTSINDITDRIKAEEELRRVNEDLEEIVKERTLEIVQSQKAYYDLVENSLVGVYITNILGDFLFVNQAFIDLLEYESASEMMSANALSIYNNKVDRKNLLDKLFQDGKIEHFECDFITKMNNIKTVLVNARLDNDTISGMVQDISMRKLAEIELHKLSRAVEQSPISVIITDTKGNMEYCNPNVTETSGYQLIELLGKNPRIFSSGETPKTEYKVLWDTLLSGKEWKGEFHNRKKNGELFWEHASISAVTNEKGIVSHFLAVKEDITERKKSIAELVKAKEKAEENDKLKSAFLANMSHEIRTPMNGILGFSELLQEPDLTGEEQKEYLAIIEESGKRMLNIIDNLMSISKIEAGQVSVTTSLTNINELIESIYTLFKPDVGRKNLQLIHKKPLSSTATIIKTDRDKVYSILTNLVKNAIKYTFKGFIEIGYEKRGGYLEFFVKDTGIGIPKERMQAIFERFVQAHLEDKLVLEGAGLGLAIVKAYVEMLGGRIQVESVEGKGSVFYFTIPCDEEPAENTIQDMMKTPARIIPAK